MNRLLEFHRTARRPSGLFRALFLPAVRHCWSMVRRPEYRLMQRLNRLRVKCPRFQPGLIHYRGHRINYVDLASLASAWEEIFVNRVYDIGIPTGKKPFLVDAGANIGLTSLYWQVRYPGFRGLAFEPDPAIAAVLRENLRSWGAQVEVHEAALGATEGRASFLVEGGDGGRVIRDGETAARGVRSVPLRRLSSFLQHPVDLLKIDIEGAELEVLEEIRPQLALVGRIFVECHSLPDRPPSCGPVLTLLAAAGFRCQVQSDWYPPKPLVHLADHETSHVNVFGVRPGG